MRCSIYKIIVTRCPSKNVSADTRGITYEKH